MMKFDCVLGISIGNGRDIKIDRAHEYYLHLMDFFKDVGDYFAINISSPNTEDLRNLTKDDYFNNLVDKIMNKREQISKGFSAKKPIIVKISPDESIDNLEKIVSYCKQSGVDGFILTNTSVDHDYKISGGLSGSQLRYKAEESLKFVRSIVGEETNIIASGSIMTKEDALNRLELKAELIQL